MTDERPWHPSELAHKNMQQAIAAGQFKDKGEIGDKQLQLIAKQQELSVDEVVEIYCKCAEGTITFEEGSKTANVVRDLQFFGFVKRTDDTDGDDMVGEGDPNTD